MQHCTYYGKETAALQNRWGLFAVEYLLPLHCALRKTERSLPLPIASQPKSLDLKWSPQCTKNIQEYHRQIIHRISYSFSNNCDSCSLAILVSFGQLSLDLAMQKSPRLFYDVVTSGPSLVMTVRNEPRLAR